MQANIHPFNRSSITNGRRPHRRGLVDGRSHSARRWRDIYLGLIADLGRKPSTVDDAQLRQAATLALRSEELSARAASGVWIDAAELTSLCSELRRVLVRLGIGGGTGETDAERERRRLEDLEAGLIR